MATSGSLAAFLKMASPKHSYGLFLICAAVLLTSSCGGGSSSGGSTGGQGSVSFSTSTISFKASAPFALAPATQTVTGVVTGVSSGTIYVTIQSNDPDNLFTVTNLTIAGDSAQVSIIPALPSLQAGSYSGSITISACLNDSTCNTGQLSGSPRTIPVNYDIASGVDGDTVTPHVVAANVAGKVILRGSGFTGATNVSFGSIAASAISVVSDSEIDASYSTLAAGTYPISIDSGGISYTASLVAVAAPPFTAVAIPLPAGDVPINPDPPGIEYDAQRTALFVLLPGGNSISPALVRYSFDANTGTWGAPTQISMDGLEQVLLSPDGTHLLAMVSPDSGHTSMVELDPVTMAQRCNTMRFRNCKRWQRYCRSGGARTRRQCAWLRIWDFQSDIHSDVFSKLQCGRERKRRYSGAELWCLHFIDRNGDSAGRTANRLKHNGFSRRHVHIFWASRKSKWASSRSSTRSFRPNY